MNRDTISKIWGEYEQGVRYKEAIGLYETVRRNERFFLGRQWEGVNAPDIDKPVFNVLKRVINYFIAMLVSDNIGMTFGLFNRAHNNIADISMNILENQVKQAMEFGRFSQIMRDILRDACVDGDGCLHVFFDQNVDTGWPDERGLVRFERMDNTGVIFGNAQQPSVQDQPYILLEQRLSVEHVRELMRQAGTGADADLIAPDSAQQENDAEYVYADKVTLVTKYWKENGHIRYAKVTRTAVVKPETETALKLYPICWMSWEKVRGRYHGESVITELLPNQMAINKLAAMAQRFLTTAAFPRMFYNEAALPGGLDNSLHPVATKGDPRDVIWSDSHRVDMSSQVGQYLDKFVTLTRDLMGASDAALGNVNPQNTSAIIATQKATAIPLELVKQSYHQFVEDFVRICIDQMRVFYGLRTVLVDDDASAEQEVPYDFANLEQYALQLNVDVGQAAYWSEVTATTSLGNMMQQGLIDPVTYVQNLPDTAIPNKAAIERKLEEQQAAQQQAAQQQAIMQQAAPFAGQLQIGQ